jgi:hypothetical protein
MTTVRLFGTSIPVPSQGSIGGLANTLKVALSADAKRLSVNFAGAHPFGTAKFDVSLPCTVVGDQVQLTPSANAGSGTSVKIDMPLGLGGAEMKPATIVVTAAGDLAFQDSSFILRSALRRVSIATDLITLDWSSAPAWSQFIVAIDIAAKQLRFSPVPNANRHEIELVDDFLTADLQPVIHREQTLSLHRVVASASAIDVVALPKGGILFVHPDILTAAETASTENDLLFQHALVNGSLHVSISGNAGVNRTFLWGAHPVANETPAMLLFRLTDEHGHPLVAEAAGGFPIAARRGTGVENDDNSGERWELTNSALIVHPAGDLPVTIQSIDPIKVGARFQDHEKQWLDEHDLVPLQNRSPVEIHGLAKGTFLRRIDGHIDPIANAVLVTQAVNDGLLGHIFTRSDLAMPVEPATWKLMTQLDERDVVPGVQETITDIRIGHRVAKAKSNTVRLPAIDTSYALANLADPKGRVQRNVILKDTTQWLADRDAQFTGATPSHFEMPSADRQTHVAGFEVAPQPASFDSIIDRPPGRALEVGSTARTGAWMRKQELHYVHGGERTVSSDDKLIKIVDGSDPGFGDRLRTFIGFWNKLDPSANVAAARAALRKLMGLERRTDLLDSEFESLLSQAKEMLHGGRRIDALDPAIVEQLRAVVAPSMTAAAFKTLWTTTADPKVIAFLDLLWSGTGPSLYRQAVDAFQLLSPGQQTALTGMVQDFHPDFASVLPGFPTPAHAGVDDVVAILTDAWNTLAELEEMRRRFGNSLTTDVYRLLLDPAHRADLESALQALFVNERFKSDLFKDGFANLRQAIENRWNHSSSLSALKNTHGAWSDAIFKTILNANERLQLFRAVVDDVIDFYSKLRVDPPDYLFFSSRVRTSVGEDERKFAERLWNQKFRLASVGGANAWSFVLDGESSVIVKLTGTRSIADLLVEIEKSYATPNQPNPLGLPAKMTMADFIERLDPAIRQKLWRGVLVIRPTADIQGDPQLKTLTGLTNVPIIYAAVGGASPDQTEDALDIYASIFYTRDPFEVAGTPEEDLTFTLIKFEATIRNTRLVAGEVLFRLDVRNVFGRDTTDRDKFPVLMLRGTVPRNKDEKSGNSFEYAAWFEHPIEYPVDIAFVKSFTFKALRVSTNRGQTSVDIDADVNLQKWDVNLGGLDFHVGPDGGSNALLNLQNFRIVLPNLPKGFSIPIGFPRLLNFELPAINFNWPNPRPLNLWDGIELAPIGMGFLRRAQETLDALNDLLGRYQWLFGAQPGGNIFQFPYLRCSIHFGKLPSFGGTNLSRLNLELIIGLIIRTPGGLPEIAIGLGGLDAREISIDLFGVIKLEVERLILDRFKTLGDQKQAVALFIKNPRLTILGWSPLPENDKLQFLFAHAEKRTDGRAVLGFYSRKPTDGFFQLFWLLVAHNLVLSTKITDYLLANKTPADADKLLDGLVDTNANPKTIDAKIVEDDSWLVGASFALKGIVEQGTFVLHDQHYYGISLRGPAIEQLFGVKRLELSYVPGPTRAQDRFRASFRLAALDLIGSLRSGDIAIEWGFNWDFLFDFGFPWKSGTAYLWERAFSLPLGTYEAKFGLYFEKRTQLAPSGATELTLAAGAGFYLGYYFGFGTPGRFVWVQAGIGVFAILEGIVTFRLPPGTSGVEGLIKGTIKEVIVRGVIGIFAYGEGGIEIWVISSRFRVSVQAAIAGELHYLPGGNSTLRYGATLNAHYEASTRVGCGIFSFTFSVSGTIGIEVSGQALLN